jgi:hypothetical protein
MKLTLLPILAAVCGVFMIINPACAQVAVSWQQTTLPSQAWASVASSADGTKLVAGQNHGLVYISTNSGAAWTPTTLSVFIDISTYSSGGHLIASSADGTKLAVATLNFIYVSHDSGATWTARASNTTWGGIASSADGTKLVAITVGGQIYTSTDSGTNWTARATGQNWTDVASSADGTRLAAVVFGGGIYTSTDSGTNWTAQNSGSQSWMSIASSADGTKLVAVDEFDSVWYTLMGAVYTSSNGGTNWTSLTTTPILNWTSVASSTNGVNLAAAASNPAGSGFSAGVIYTSTNSGASWQLSYAPDSGWRSVVSSADGTKLAAVNTTAVYTYAAPSTNAPALNISAAGGSSFLSWPWPSTGFALQQNTNLATTNWVTVSNTPAVVNQMIAAQTNANNFYRLANP